MKILFLLWAETSSYNASYRLAHVLSSRGHEVVYAVPARWQETVEKQGFRTHLVKELTPQGLWSTAGGWPPNRARSRAAAFDLIRDLCESYQWIQAEGFSLVLLYSTLWFLVPVLKCLGIPYIATNACLASVQFANIPPVFSTLAPIVDRPFANRLRNRLAWRRFMYFGAYNHRYRGVMQSGQSRLKDMLAGLKHFWAVINESRRMPVYTQLVRIARLEGAQVEWGDYGMRLAGPELVLGPEELDFPGHRPRVYAGACVETGRVEPSFDWSLLDDKRPLVYCTVGSHGGHWNQENRLRLLEAAIRAFQARPHLQLLLQLSGEGDLERFRPLLGDERPCEGNILARPWFPQLQALSRSKLIISHGGFGTMREALFYGVPLVLYPLGVDQPGNAARVVRLGVGLAGDVRKVSPEEIGSLVDTVLGSRAIQERAERLGERLRQDNECTKVVDWIEKVV